MKRARTLQQHKARAQSGLFLIEGIHHVGAAIEAGWEIEAILYSPDDLRSQFAHELVARFPGRVEPLPSRILQTLAGKDNPQGILAIAQQRYFLLSQLHPIQSAVALVSPQDPGNVGTILRTLDAVGADCLFILDGGVDAYHPTAIRASMGALFWKPVVRTTFVEFDAWRRECGYSLIGSSAHGELDFAVCQPTKPWILLCGSEQKGLTEEHARACTAMVSLPMQGHASSLNLAVAASVLLYAFSSKNDWPAN